MLSLVLMMAVAQSHSTGTGETMSRTERIWREGMRAWGRNTRMISGYAFFEFAPASGAGMGTACACTTPTGAKGEAMTFTRASNGTCTKGNVSTGIANGDVVVCSTNQPRVMPGGDGSGALGLLVESARTNSALRSQELDNASWTKEGSVTGMTATADQAVAPDGTTTAERLVAVATSGVNYSDMFQTFNTAALGDSTTCTIYVKGNGTSDTTDLCAFNGGSWSCSACAYVSSTWSRCTHTVAGATSVARYCKFGNNSLQNGGVARNALDVFAWGAQGESPAAYATSYIPTTSAAATRTAEVMTRTFPAALGPVGSAALTMIPLWTGSASGFQGLRFNAGSSNARLLYTTGSTMGGFDGTTGPTTAAGYTAGTPKRYWSSWSAANGWVVRNATDANQNTSAFTSASWTAAATATLYIDGFDTTFQADSVLKQICYDPSESRCR